MKTTFETSTLAALVQLTFANHSLDHGVLYCPEEHGLGALGELQGGN